MVGGQQYEDRSGGNVTLTQAYGYDGVNRLQSAGETVTAGGSGGGAWSFTHSYDRFGNMWVTPTGGLTAHVTTPTQQAVGCRVDLALTGTGVTYDAAGNLTAYPFLGAMQYDAENHQKQFTSGSTTVTYHYDGDGRRVKQVKGSETTVFVYDVFGNLAAEYSTAAPTETGGRRYRTTDHLGSTRLVTDDSGTVKTRHDYVPFGEELPASSSAGNRNLVFGFGVSPSERHKFTGKERDGESGLDYFAARYTSGAQGRFTSPDPLLSSAHIAHPQSWNRYAYTLNNPLRFTDPHGLYICNGTAADCKDFESALKQVERARNSYKKGSAEYKALDGSLQAYGKKGVDNGVTVQFGATRSGGAGDANIGIAVTADTANKAITTDNPTGQNTVVTFDLAKHSSNGSVNTGLLAVSAAHEGVHVGHGAALVGALPMDLTSSTAAGVLGGPLNLTKYATEFAAYGASSNTAQGLGFGSLRVGGNFEIWNSGWKAVDVNTLRSNGINRVLADPNGLYKVTPGAPGKKVIE